MISRWLPAWLMLFFARKMPRALRMSPEFHAELLRRWGTREPGLDADVFAKVLLGRLAMNRRGLASARSVEAYLRQMGTSMSGRRVADLGCGAGGFLHGAAELSAADCEGWEIDESRIELAKMNLQDVSATTTIRNKSLDDPSCLDGIDQPFDVIVCEQVLEHVKNIDQSFANIAKAIDPRRGVGFLSIPNGFSLRHVLADPHLLIFGISLLDRFEGAPLAKAIAGTEHYATFMGTYLTADDYREKCHQHRLAMAERHDFSASEERVTLACQLLHKARARCATAITEWRGNVPSATLRLVEDKARAYLDDCERRLTAIRAEPRGSASKLALRDLLVDTFEFVVVRLGSECEQKLMTTVN